MKFHFTENDTVRFSSPTLNITDPRGETLFSANKNEIVFNTEKVRFTGNCKTSQFSILFARKIDDNLIFFQGHDGAVFDSSIQTPMIRGHYKQDLT